ncbi:hypothetical protein [Burkholderia sp. S-53]|uniref:hypothetical protein n=1 Tax=Burkholderia sp. S-53 TaxID=2906514 RepID=UPI0021D2E652|nr:hypothetical protein [Burkholderia sp. S-53]UXU86302.1 hypothetical protein LXM88_14035 [Burkholderia sp. S-53]
MTARSAPQAWADDATLGVVRPKVRDMLLAVPAFSHLMPAEQQAIASQMVKVAAYMANPDGALAGTQPAAPPVAAAQADNVAEAGRRATENRGFASKQFDAAAVRQGVQQFGELVQKVDFPKFVGGLIQNVFQAIVDSSIQQMRAYGELLANVAKTVDEFAQDNISENNARDWLSGKYPDVLDIDTTTEDMAQADGAAAPAPQPVLVAKGDDPAAGLQRISGDLGLAKPVTDISSPEDETRLVLAARQQMARSRQQLLASMVMLGINRIVITDGHINAKVVFDMRAADTAGRVAKASLYDAQHDSSTTTASASTGGWFNPIQAGISSTETSDHMTTVSSAVDDTSESKAQVKAQLSGEVRVNFKSDYFPMEKLASPDMIAAIQGNSVPQPQPKAAAAAKP